MFFEKLQKLKKLSLDDKTVLVNLLRQIGRDDLASELESWKCLNENAKEIDKLTKKSRVFQKEGKFCSESEIYGKILELCSNDEDGKLSRCKFLKKRAASLIAQEKFEDALKDCRNVLDQNPHDLKAKFFLARSYEGLREYSKAYEELKLLKVSNPKDPDVLILLEKVARQVDKERREESHSTTCQASGISPTANFVADGNYPHKVLFVCDKWSGWHLDIYSVNRHLCRHFAKFDCLRVACLVLEATEKDIVLANKEGISLKRCSVSSGIPDGDNRLYAMHGDFPFIPDVVFGHGLVTGAEASGLAKKFNCKHFHICYDVNFTKEELQVGNDADFVAAIGPQLAKEWSNKLGREVIEIIPGIPSDSRQRNSIPTPHNRALIVDSTASTDNDVLDVAIKALLDCKQRDTSMEINIQGTPRAKKDNLKTKLERELGTKKFKIHITSDDASIELVDGDMRANSLLLIPSLSQTFGMRSLESISSGVPVIVSNSYGITDVLLDHFDHKFWIFLSSAKEEDDYESWSDRIDVFLDNRDEKFALASELKHEWEKKFTWDSATTKILHHLSRSGEFPKAAKACNENYPSLPSCSSEARSFVQTDVELHERRKSHILVVCPVDARKDPAIRHLAKIPWIAVLDFDPHSTETGCLSICQTLGDELGTKICPIRCPRDKVKEKVTFPNGIPWLLVDETPECLKWLKNVISTLETSHLEQISMLVLWNASKEKERLTRALGKFLNNIEASSLQERVKVAIDLVGGDKEYFIKGIEEDWDTSIYHLPLADICNAINESVCENPSLREREKFFLPVADGIESGKVIMKILPNESRWINAELEILYQSVSDNPEYDSKDAQHFYRGGTISWYALSKGYAIRRKNWDPIKDKIDELLPRCGTLRRKLFHSRGTGGTTSSRWILFEYHKKYPCVNVKSINHQETASAIKVLADFCKLPVLVLIDCKHVLREEFDLDILYNSLSNQRVSCIVLEVSHRQENHVPRKKELLTIAETLAQEERDRFITTYGEQKQERVQRLRSLKKEPDELQIPFYYALVTYEDKFIALEPFVKDCLEDSGNYQRKALIFLSLCHHYAHIAVPEAALTSIFEDAPRDTALEVLLTEDSLQLLLEENGGWRPRHDLIGRHMLKRLLSDGINKDNWIQNLANVAIDFISHMPENLVSELLKNRTSTSEFSPLIDEIPDDDEVIKVFEKAIETFPDNPHFSVHLGRVYSIKKEATGFEMAVRCTDDGIQSADRVFASREVRGQFAQMKGVVYSRRVSFLIKEEAQVKDIVPFAEEGVDWFRRSVSICPDVIDGYIPEVKMMCNLLEYVHKTEGDLHDYLRKPECPTFIVDGISQTTDTLDCVPDSEYYSYWKSRLVCLGQRKNRKDLRKTLKLLEEIRLDSKISRGPINRKIVEIKIELCRHNKADLSTVASDVITFLLEALNYAQNVKEKELTMRLWIQIAPFVPVHLSDAERLIFKWCNECRTVRSHLYKYIISFIHVLDGSKHYLVKMRNAHHDLESEVKVINRGDVGRLRHPDKPVVWLGSQNAKGMGQLVYLENIFKDKKPGDKNILAPEHTRNLQTLTGIITVIERNVGTIVLKDGLDVRFRTDLCDPSLSSKTFCNRKVQFHLGFNFFGPDAYNVKLM
ncbi:uncharacterized protein LOC110250398 isoform X2 [Exaiptasia diaphana]|nr:uncharacterized protein LOC110250398 isoform X2 [Exaiptasia diaphana]XP_028518387.1 uncharacterized protein LOC110250398 isoform X2 [Exaiptasia diaphana]